MQLTLKSSTWQVMLQSRKSRELTVNPYSCGSYDLIWYNALHLTNIAGLFEVFYKAKDDLKMYKSKRFLKNKHQAVHGCRQFVFWYVWLSPLTNVTLDSILLFQNQENKKKIDLLLIKDQMKVRIMSSRYALNILGYPYDTMALTKCCWDLYFG